MRQPKEFGLLKEMAKELRDVKRRLMHVEILLEGEELTKEELKQIKKSEAEIKQGKYVTLDQLKKELRLK